MENKSSLIEDKFKCWFSGFFDGEGHLLVKAHDYRSDRKPSVGFAAVIKIRSDDFHTIREIYNRLGGTFCFIEMKSDYKWKGNRQVRWGVQDIKTLVEVIFPIFDTFQLRTKKKFEYELIKPLALRFYEMSKQGYKESRLVFYPFYEEVLALKKKLTAIRTYSGTKECEEDWSELVKSL